MKLVYPEFLYALLALLIPIIVHLFNFRRFKKVRFTNVKFLEEVQLETKSRSRLKHLLVLASRLLALACLVLAFCIPYIPKDDKEIVGQKAVSVYVDNSFSMTGDNDKGELLEQAKEMARKVAQSYSESDRFQILTNDFEGRHQRLLSREEFLEMVDEIEVSPNVKSLSEVTSRIEDAVNDEGTLNKRAFVFSDFQKTAFDIGKVNSDTSIYYNLVPIQQRENSNIYIDSIGFKVPVRQYNHNEELQVKVVNLSDRALDNLSMKLMINGVQKAIGNISIEANSSAIGSLFYTNDQSGIVHGEVSITDHPITFDDRYYFSYDVLEKINILKIGGANKAVDAVFADDNFFNLSTNRANEIDFGLFSTQNLIILDGLKSISSGLVSELGKFTELGGSVLIIPEKNLDKASYNELLLGLSASRISTVVSEDMEVGNLNLESYFYDGVFAKIPRNIDLPLAKWYLKFNTGYKSKEEVLLTLNNGDAYLSQFAVNNGKCYVFASGITDDAGNLSRHALFVTSLLRMAELSNGRQPLAYTIGEDDQIKVNYNYTNREEPVHIKSYKGDMDIIPEFRVIEGQTVVMPHDQINLDGHYTISFEDQDITGVAYNYERSESQMTFLNKEEIQSQLNQNNKTNFKIIEADIESETTLGDLTEGKSLWKWFIFAALLFLLIEILLIRLL